MAILDQTQIREGLKSLEGWGYDGSSIVLTRKFPGFMESIDFVNRVAPLAEEANHHPDITINYNRVTLALSTHSEGGVTQKDLDLARRINQLQ